MMNLDVYSMATTRQAELERAMLRHERLRQAGVVAGPSMTARFAGLVHRIVSRVRADRELAVRPAAAPHQISCLTTRGHEPA